MKYFNCIWVTALFTICTLAAKAQSQVTAIMGALESEQTLLKSSLQHQNDTVIQGIHFYSGLIADKAVVLVRCGVGKVNAAIVTTLLVDHFKPACILFSGIAGGLNSSMHPGDVIIAEKLSYHDYGRQWPDSFENWATRHPASFANNPMYFMADSLLLSLALESAGNVSLREINGRIPQVRTGIVLTGDMFLSDGKYGGKLRSKTNADAVEMEGASVAQVSYQFGVPFLVIRSLSDSANDDAALDFNQYGTIAAGNSASIILGILKRL